MPGGPKQGDKGELPQVGRRRVAIDLDIYRVFRLTCLALCLFGDYLPSTHEGGFPWLHETRLPTKVY